LIGIIIMVLIITNVVTLNILYRHIDGAKYLHSIRIENTRAHLGQAYSSLSNYKTDDLEYLKLQLDNFSMEMKNASELLEGEVLYFNVMENEVYSPSQIHLFFGGFHKTALTWKNAIILNEVDKMPTENELDSFMKDIRVLIDMFDVYPPVELNSEMLTIEQMSYQDLMNHIQKITDSIELEKIKNNMEI